MKLDLVSSKWFLLIHNFNQFPYSPMQNTLAFSSFFVCSFHLSSNNVSLDVQLQRQARQNVSNSLIFVFQITHCGIGRNPIEEFLNHTFSIARSSKVPTANGYQNEMQLKADSSERSSLLGGTKGIHKSQGKGVQCLCSHQFRQVYGELCFPKTLRIKGCHILEKMLSVLQMGLIMQPVPTMCLI